MKYTYFYERVAKEDEGYRVVVEYEFDGVEFQKDEVVPTVSAANKKLQEYRQLFRAGLKLDRSVDESRPPLNLEAIPF